MPLAVCGDPDCPYKKEVCSLEARLAVIRPSAAVIN